MSRFNTKTTQPPRQTAPIVSTPSAILRTGNNAPGFERDAKSELFLLAVANFVGQNTFYETGLKRDERFAGLIRQVAVEDQDWLTRFLPWLRNTANMRTAAVVGAVEATLALLAAGRPGGRAIVADSLARADEPGEVLGYYMNHYGRKIPNPIKRGVGDAAARLYKERSTLKYDTASHSIRFGHVLELCHPKPKQFFQNHLFQFLVTRGRGRDNIVIPDSLTMLVANEALRRQAAETPQLLLNTARLQMAGMNWEDALSLAGTKVGKKELWEALIPTMGFMALLRNLRNFDQAGISNQVAQQVAQKLADPAEVAGSRQLPLRFLSAYKAVPSDRWAWPLEQALQHCLLSVPEFAGRTLILIDTSGSMRDTFSKDGTLRRWDAAAMFGLALAARCEHSTVVQFANSSRVVSVSKGHSLLKALTKFLDGAHVCGGGTATQDAVRRNYAAHDRVIILTDEQANYHGHYDVAAAVPASIPVFTFNLAGYKAGHAPSGSATRVTIGGLSDAAFQLLPALEARGRGVWPF